mmetsp:Transcript_18398/g.24282  ORF Transcript_18398/g.24282 Transcript_18398/m.24282 type:complete len:163 (+) Transcript_18398:40-528(+)|eukprot:CAMPEP_0117743324 /NCGR_PEP_ID=MMETSP0947-20121206/6067_1 /TAXON_ID=44440 /ORGANISM="Chattonella subsalsa, Strain CCMP2191" /LENGTH=162 /DNA_ID=CAMNT_0005560003 /DNA_START=21 /DNA_END=509 /DNA_ORIENTATION=+
MADQLTEEQLAEYKEAFSIFDKDADGKISVREFGTLLRSLGQYPTEAEILEMAQEADADGIGLIGYTEFLTQIQKKAKDVVSGEDISDALKVFDNNESGLSSSCAVEYIMKNLGEKLSEEEWAEMGWLSEWLHSAENKDVDGNISNEKFVEFLEEMMNKEKK